MATRSRAMPRKQAKQERSKAIVSALLDATAKLLIDEGYDGLTTNRIAKVAGVNIASLYQYFPSKEALVGALIDRRVQEVVEGASPYLEELARGDLRVATRALVASHFRSAIDPKLRRVMVEQIPRVQRVNPMIDQRRTIVAVVAHALQLRAARLRVADPELAAFMAVHVVEAMAEAATLERPELLTSERFVDEVTDLLMRYLLADGAS